jgi:hypothetical protein
MWLPGKQADRNKRTNARPGVNKMASILGASFMETEFDLYEDGLLYAKRCRVWRVSTRLAQDPRSKHFSRCSRRSTCCRRAEARASQACATSLAPRYGGTAIPAVQETTLLTAHPLECLQWKKRKSTEAEKRAKSKAC